MLIVALADYKYLNTFLDFKTGMGGRRMADLRPILTTSLNSAVSPHILLNEISTWNKCSFKQYNNVYFYILSTTKPTKNFIYRCTRPVFLCTIYKVYRLFYTRNCPQEFSRNVLSMGCVFHTTRSYPRRFLQIMNAFWFTESSHWCFHVLGQSRGKDSGLFTSGTKRENPNLIRRRICSMIKIAASPGSNLHFPSASYKQTRSAQLVQIDITIRNWNFEKRKPCWISNVVYIKPKN